MTTAMAMTDLKQRPLPAPTGLTRPFWDAAREGRLLVQKCNACARLQFYPRPFCLACMSDDMGWRQSAGQGAVYTFTVNHRAAIEYLADQVPYVVAVVQLDEGPRLMGRVLNAKPGTVAIGARVNVVFESTPEGIALPCFGLQAAQRRP